MVPIFGRRFLCVGVMSVRWFHWSAIYVCFAHAKAVPCSEKITWIPQNLQPGQTKKIEKHTSLQKKTVWPIHSCWTAKRKEVLWSYKCRDINLSFFMLPLDPFGLMLLPQMQTFPNQHFSDLVIEFQSTIVASAISKLLPKQKKSKHVKTQKHYEVLHPSIATRKKKRSSTVNRLSLTFTWPWALIIRGVTSAANVPAHSYRRYGCCLPSFWNIFQGLPWSLGYVCFFGGYIFF